MNFYNSTHRHYCGVDLHARRVGIMFEQQEITTTTSTQKSEGWLL